MYAKTVEVKWGNLFMEETWQAERKHGNISTTSTNDYLYTEGKGFGFVTETVREKQESLKVPENNAGFDILYWYIKKEITTIHTDPYGCFAKAEIPVPLFFKAQVPKAGNYKVTLTLNGGEDGVKNLTLFAGRRHMFFHDETISPKEDFEYTFIIHAEEYIPRGENKPYANYAVDLAIIGEGVHFKKAEIAESSVPTIFLAGDSTVTDQPSAYPYTPGACYSGWGQMLSAYLHNTISVSNSAHSGLTTESNRKEGHYAVMKQYIRQGDYVFFQFGHNDQKLIHLKAKEGYRDNLIAYIKECRELGATPILVSPLCRNTWKEEGRVYADLLEEYYEVCLELGETYHVPVIDLHKKSRDFITEYGLMDAKPYFYPGDYTHSNDYGAFLFAGFVVAEMEKIPQLKKYLLEEKPKAWIPSERPEIPKENKEVSNQKISDEEKRKAADFMQIPYSGDNAKSPQDVTKELEFLCECTKG